MECLFVSTRSVARSSNIESAWTADVHWKVAVVENAPAVFPRTAVMACGRRGLWKQVLMSSS